MEQNQIDLKLVDFLRTQGYHCVIPVPGRGLCAIVECVFGEWDLCYGLSRWCITGRYGYASMPEALVALWRWDGRGDPPGNWAVHKGQGFKIKNPKYDSGL